MRVAGIQRGIAQLDPGHQPFAMPDFDRPFAGAAHAFIQRVQIVAAHDMLQKRDLALARYQAVIANGPGTPPAETARRFIKEAYRE